MGAMDVQERGASRHIAARSVPVALAIYVAAIVVGEALIAFVAPLSGAVLYAVVLLLVVNHDAWLRARSVSGSRVLSTLAVLPVLRIASLTMPLTELPEIAWYAAVGIPILAAAMLAGMLSGLTRADLGLVVAAWRPQAAVAATGVPLGLVAYLVAAPSPVAGTSGVAGVIAGALILLVFAGLLEELVFRGLVQTVFEGALGCPGVVWSTLLFAVMQLGARDAPLIVLMSAVGLGFGLCVRRTGSIVGVAAAHGLLATGLLIAWPRLLGG
jgi:uncharacterized protein